MSSAPHNSNALSSISGSYQEAFRDIKEPMADRRTKRLNEVGLEFLKAEVSTGLSFADIALSAHDEERRKRNSEKARAAYDAILKFAPHVEMTEKESGQVSESMARLKHKLTDLGHGV